MSTRYIQSVSPLVLPWIRPSDWPVIDDVGDNEIHILVKEGNGIAFIVTTNDESAFTVDWGDGTIAYNQPSDVVLQHVYSANGTPCSLGYNTWKIRIFDASSEIREFVISKHSQNVRQQYTPILDIAFGTNNLAVLTLCNNVANGLSLGVLKSCTLPQFLSAISLSELFSNAYNLEYVKFPDSLGQATSAASMLHMCRSLRSFKMWSSWGNVTAANSCFQYSGLHEVVLPSSWGSVNTVASMFYMCPTLKKVVLPSTWGSITTTALMFRDAPQLRSVNLPSSWGASQTLATEMFQGCATLENLTIPSSWGSLTDIVNMFSQTALKKMILPTSWGSLQKISSLFANCSYLTEVTGATAFGASLIEAISVFSYCYELKTVNNLEFIGNSSTPCDLSGILSNISSFSASLTFNTRLKKLGVYGSSGLPIPVTSIRLTAGANNTFLGSGNQVDVQYSNLDAAALALLFGDLPSGLTGKTIAITGSTGAPALISKASSGTTTDSTTITMSNTSGLATGMEVYGTGVSTAKAVTFTDAGDLVGRTAHGLANGTKVSFSSITSTTGIVVSTQYFVVNQSANSFQVSDTLGGAAKALTTNGSGNIIVIPTIITINTNTNIIISAPCSATASVTVTAGTLTRSIALLKGWTVTG